MKRNIAHLIFFILLLNANGQQSIKLTWGAFYGDVENNKDVHFINFSHKDSSHIIFLNNSLDLVEYNYNLEQVYKSSAKKSIKGTQICAVNRKKDESFIISVNTKGEHLLQKFDTAQYTFQEASLLFTSQLGKSLKVKYSPDSTRLLFHEITTDKTGTKLELVVLNENLKKEWQQTVVVTSPIHYFHSPVITNSGAVYYADTDGKYLLVNGLSQKGEAVFSKTIAYKSTKVLTPIFMVTGENLFVVQGYKKENIQFDCVTDIDVFQYDNTGNIISSYNYPFAECLTDLQITHLHILTDGDLLIISELLSTKTSVSSNHVHYGSLHIMRFDLETKSVVWEREIFKKHYYVTTPDKFASQHQKEYELLHNHKMYEYNGELLFVYNDNCTNCMTNSIGQNPISHSDLNNSCLNMVKINADGKVVRNIYSGKINVKYYVIMNNVLRISNNRVIVWAVNKQLFRLGRLHLD